VIKKLVFPTIITMASYVVAYGVLTSWLGHRPLTSGLAILASVAALWFTFSVTNLLPDDIILPRDTTPTKPIPPFFSVRVKFLISAGVALIAWVVAGLAIGAVPAVIKIGTAVFLVLVSLDGLFRTVRSRNLALSEAVHAIAQADRIQRQARLHLENGAVVEAVIGYQEVLSVRRRYRPNSHVTMIEALSDLAQAHLRLRQYRETIALAEELRPLLANYRGESPDHIQIIAASNEREQGAAHMGLKEYAAAIKHFAAAVVIWERLLLRAADSETLSDLIKKVLGDAEFPIFEDLNRYALACALKGNAEEAIKQDEYLIERETSWVASRGLDRETLLELVEAASIEAFCYVFWQPLRAIRRGQQALALEALVNGVADGDSHLTLGMAWEELGAFAVARHHYQLGLQPEGGEQSPDHLRALGRLGKLAFTEEDYAASARFYEKALAGSRDGVNEESVSANCIGLAKALLALEEPARAHNLAREALRLRSHETVRAETYSVLSEIHAQEGSLDAAIMLGKRAANLMRNWTSRFSGGVFEADARAGAAPIIRRLAGHLVDAGRLAEAQQVLDLLKEQEYDDFVTRGGGPRSSREGLMHESVGSTQGEAAWNRHGDNLDEAISVLASERQNLLEKPERDAAENDRLEALHNLLDDAKQDLDDWLDKLVDTLRTERPTAQEQVRSLNLDLLETLRGDLAELGPGAALAHFILGTRRLAVILTKPDLQVSREVAVNNVEIYRLLHRFRREIRLHKGDLISLRQLSSELYKYLIAPISEYLGNVETLMVVLDGALRYLPLAALYDGSKYLIERCGVVILTPASYTRLKDRPVDWTAGGGVGGLGSSRHSDRAGPLAAVGDELRAIIREGQETEGIYPGKRYLDEGFTAAALVTALHAHKAIHIASHFEFSATNDAASALLLGDGTELSLQQLQADRFTFRNIELVTLSACETALGTERSEAVALQGLRRMNGVEFESLGATIQKRGAKAVIATLWAVEDDSTATIMKFFYKARRDGKTKVAALRSAQLALLHGDGTEKLSHPYFWAPFVLMGNWQ
jgi:CHAT domain-containing protein